MTTSIKLTGICCQASIGVFDWEHKVKQQIHIDIALDALLMKARLSDKLEDTVDYKQLVNKVVELCESKHYGLLEKLIEEIALMVLDFDSKIVSFDLSVHKSGALRLAQGVSVHCKKQRNQVIVGLGSNIDAQQNIAKAISNLNDEFSVAQQCEWLTTKAIARPNNPDFINTAVMIHTNLDEQVLARRLKHIEYEMGREQRNKDAYASRVIDLDLMLWNDRIIDADLYQRDFLQNLTEQLVPGMIAHLHYWYQLPVLITLADKQSQKGA